MHTVGGTRTNRVVNLEGGDQFARSGDIDGQVAIGHLVDKIREIVGDRSEAREIVRPGHHHLQLSLALRICRGRQCGRGRDGACLQKFASIKCHAFPP